MPDDRPSDSGMLMSWKEIAAFFKRDVRTVQRWEREQDLPVHRHQHNRQSSVYADRAELEAWWRQHQSLDEAPRRRGRIRRVAVPAAAALATLTLAVIVSTTLSTERSGSAGRFGVQRLAENAGVIHSLADINDDGLADAVTGSGAELAIYWGRTSRHMPEVADVRITTTLNAELTGGILGDVDGDGLADLVLTALLREPDAFHGTGPSYLVRGRRQWPAALQLPRDADVTLAVDLAEDIRMGPCVERPVDLNSDGLSDVVLGAADFSPSGRRSAGGIFVLFGRRAWASRIDVLAGADIAIHGSRDGEGLAPRCGTGDFDGDRRPDLAIAASETTLWGMRGGRGRVYVVAGRDQWPRLIDLNTHAALTLEGTTPLSEVTSPVLADVNGDRVDDLIVGIVSGRPNPPSGRVAVFFGGRQRPGRMSLGEADVTIAGAETVNEFGDAVAAHDVNRDGRADLIVGDPRNGTVGMFLGRERWPRRGPPAVYRPIELVSGDIGAGAIKLVLGDYDGDGAMDLVFPVDPPRSGTNRPRWAAMLKPYLPIAIDIRPADSPNVLLASGIVGLGISGAGPTAPAELEEASLTLAGEPATHKAWRDFNHDGVPDLLLYFDVAKLSIRADTKRLALIGRTRQGLPVSGADDVTVVVEEAKRSMPAAHLPR